LSGLEEGGSASLLGFLLEKLLIISLFRIGGKNQFQFFCMSAFVSESFILVFKLLKSKTEE